MTKHNQSLEISSPQLFAVQDADNLDKIIVAQNDGRLDLASATYLRNLYSDGMHYFREMFYFLGKMLGAPKTPIYPYDSDSGNIEKPVEIALIGPMGTYLVNHRFDSDPIRNQFFLFQNGCNTSLAVSSIVTVIVAAQKKVSRAIEKISTKYYDDYVTDVLNISAKVLGKHANQASVNAISEKIKTAFYKKHITNAAEEIISIIGPRYEKIVVELVRELDKIILPHSRLRDVYRVKMLFDIIPQARAFIDSISEHMPDKIILIRDKFYNLGNKRNYRDAKVIVNIGTDGAFVPMEIICQVRTFFNFEIESHQGYEKIRSAKLDNTNLQSEVVMIHHNGVLQYNNLIFDCVRALLERVGWNILYSRDYMSGESLLDGFPKIQAKLYPKKIIEEILRKIDNNVQNEIFKIQNAARKLKLEEEIGIFRYIANFILASALPYAAKYYKITGTGAEFEVFNFVMAELYRYYENDVL